MNDKEEQLLITLGEECAEVIKEASKCLRFGPDNNHQSTTPRHRLELEILDLLAMVELLEEEGFINITEEGSGALKMNKKHKVMKFIKERGK
jgi:hypothetical protein